MHKTNFDDVADRTNRLKDGTLAEIVKQLQDYTFKSDPDNVAQTECMRLISDIDYVASHVDGSITA